MAARRLSSVFATAGLALIGAAPVFAQTSPTREEIQREGLQPDSPTLQRQLDVEDGIERAPCPLAQPRFAEISFQLNDVTFANLVEVSPEQLRPSYSQYVGQTVPIATVCEIRDRAATILRHEGYLAAVQVPPQQIGADGIVRFDVLMARLSRIQVRGETGNSERIVEDYLQPLTEAPVFNQRDAERSLLLARELPGYDTRLTLRPTGEEPGTVIGDVRIQRTRYVLEGNVLNYGSKSAGRFGGQIRAQINDITGLGDRTNIGFYSTADFNEALVLSLSHDFAIGGDGLRLGGEFTYAWNDPTLGGASPFDTETLIATSRLSYPFVLDQATRIGGTIGFELIDQHVDFNGVRLNEDNLRTLFARVDANFVDRDSINGIDGYSAAEPRWRFGISAELRQGIDIFGASQAGTLPTIPIPQTRSAGKSDATVFRVEGVAELRPSPTLAFVLQPRLQLTADPLLAYEEFSAGNYTVGRGYDPGSVLGDQGVGFRYEIRAGSALPRTRDDLAWQPYAFFDAAWTWNEDPAFLGFSSSDRLFSTGAGVRANYGDRARFDVALAVPLRRTLTQASTPDPRLLVSATIRFAQ